MAASSNVFLTSSLSKRNVLVVGDGNFSFSRCLADCATNYECSLVFTSFDSREKLHQNAIASENLSKLATMENVVVLHGVDATNLSQYFPGQKFDRIIFNFPHTGGKSNIKKCRQLLRDFFLSAVQHVHVDVECAGDVCVTLCKGQGGTPQDQPHRSRGNSWQIVDNAANAGLILNQLLPFVSSDYTHYQSVGYRSRLKQGFNTSGGLVHIFIPGVKIGSVQDLRDCSPDVLFDHITEYAKELHTKAIHNEPSHPVQLLKNDIIKKLSNLSDLKLKLPFKMLDDEDFAPHTSYEFQSRQEASCSKEKHLINTSISNRKVLSALKDHGCFVCCFSSLIVPQEISATSNMFETDLVIGRLFQQNEDNTCSCFLKANEELDKILSCLKVGDACEYDDSHVVSQSHLKWTNSSDVAHLAKRKCHLNTKDLECSSLNQTNTTCNCKALRHKYLSKDYRLNVEEFIISELMVPETMQVSKYSSTIVFQSGHLNPDVLQASGINNTCMYGWLVKVNLTVLAMIRHDISDIRLLWSEAVKMEPVSEKNNVVCNEVVNSTPSVHKLVPRPLSLFPASYVHDISFWVSDEVSQELFMIVTLGFTKNCLKEMKLAEIYHDEHKHWLSFNYRMVYSRADGPLSHLEAVELQNNLRRVLLALGFGLK